VGQRASPAATPAPAGRARGHELRPAGLDRLDQLGGLPAATTRPPAHAPRRAGGLLLPRLQPGRQYQKKMASSRAGRLPVAGGRRPPPRATWCA
jgi:hypothetical protein